MLGADARVVEPGRDRMRVGDLAVLVGEEGGAGAVEDAGPPGAEARRSGRLDPDQAHVGVVDEAGEQADGVRASAHAGDDGVGEPALGSEDLRTASRPITAWSSPTSSGYGCGPTQEPIM